MSEILKALSALLPWNYIPPDKAQPYVSPMLVLGSDSRASGKDKPQAGSEWRAA